MALRTKHEFVLYKRTKQVHIYNIIILVILHKYQMYAK